MPRILVVEDDASLRDDLTVFLEAKGYTATGAATVAGALQTLEAAAFDLILLDLGLPDGNGLDLLRQVRARCGLRCGVVVLSARNGLEDRLQALEAGSDGYLIKQASLREIEGTLRNLLQRLPPAAPHAQPRRPRDPHATTPDARGPHTSLWTLHRLNRTLTTPAGTPVALTARELVFLDLLAAQAGAVCPHQDLTAALAEHGGDASQAGLMTLVRRLRQKVQDQTGQESPVRTVYGRGYCFAGSVTVLPPAGPSPAAR